MENGDQKPEKWETVNGDDKTVKGEVVWNGKKPRESRMFNRERLKMKARDYLGVVRIVRDWGRTELGKKDQERYDEYIEIWRWMKLRGGKDGVDVEALEMTPGGIRMSLEYMRLVLEDQMGSYTPVKLRSSCLVKLDDYLRWYESEMAQLVFRCEQIVEEDRIRSQFHLVRKKLLDGLEKDKKNSVETWAKMMGKYKPKDNSGERGYNITVVDKYKEE